VNVQINLPASTNYQRFDFHSEVYVLGGGQLGIDRYLRYSLDGVQGDDTFVSCSDEKLH
jgi:hypothetical protein